MEHTVDRLFLCFIKTNNDMPRKTTWTTTITPPPPKKKKRKKKKDSNTNCTIPPFSFTVSLWRICTDDLIQQNSCFSWVCQQTWCTCLKLKYFWGRGEWLSLTTVSYAILKKMGHYPCPDDQHKSVKPAAPSSSGWLYGAFACTAMDFFVKQDQSGWLLCHYSPGSLCLIVSYQIQSWRWRIAETTQR